MKSINVKKDIIICLFLMCMEIYIHVLNTIWFPIFHFFSSPNTAVYHKRANIFEIPEMLKLAFLQCICFIVLTRAVSGMFTFFYQLKCLYKFNASLQWKVCVCINFHSCYVIAFLLRCVIFLSDYKFYSKIAL